MRDDIISQISDLREIDHVVVLTHNIDFAFSQTVFLSALRKCGHPNLTLFADAQCARESYEFQSAMVTGLGKRFRVIPVSMEPGFRFHPKAIFLCGKNDCVLFMGSGNMTFGGLRENAEVWRRFDSKKDDFPAIAMFRDYLNQLPARVAFSDSVSIDLTELFDPQNNLWAETLDEPGDLIGRLENSDSLLTSFSQLIGNSPVKRITVATPYFDPEGDALKTLSETFNNPPTDVLIQSRRSTLFSETANSLPKNITLKTISYINPDKEGSESSRFIHAKFFAFELENEVLVIAGSANCSRAALLKSASSGNAELVTYQAMSLGAFETEFLSEFSISDIRPELISEDDVDDVEASNTKIHALGARFDIATLAIQYTVHDGASVTRCMVDGRPKAMKEINNGDIKLALESAPSSVILEGEWNGEKIQSNEIWVDNESALRSTSKGRALLESIRSSKASGSFEPEDWNLIVELFAKDLDYTTARELKDGKTRHENSENAQDIEYTREDVFSESYATVPTLTGRLNNGAADGKTSLHNLLLHAFGISPTSSQVDDPDNLDEEDQSPNPNSDEEAVDEEENLKPKKRKKPRSKAVIQQQTTQLVNSITDSFTDPTYLELRDPLRLGTDLQIAGLLLRKAYSKDWITKDAFFDATQKIWSALFFRSAHGTSVGWLTLRYQLAEDREKFVSELSSPQLAGALFSWASAIDLDDEKGPYAQRFLMSILLSVGRYPWLWYEGIDEDETYLHILRIAEDSPCGTGDSLDITSVHNQRISLLRQGVSLARLEATLRSDATKASRDTLISETVSAGDFLWQGTRSICIALQGSAYRDRTEVMCLQDPEGSATFLNTHLMPLRQALAPNALPAVDGFEEPQRREMVKILDALDSLRNEQ